MSLVSVNVPTVINADKSHGSITLPTNSITLQRRISATVTATGITGTLSARAIDTSIATATASGSDIVVTGVAPGTTTVIVDVAESAGYTSTYTTFDVTVTEANILANPATNTLAKLKAIIAAGNATQYVSAGDYFDITIPTAVSMYRDASQTALTANVIAANSTWRVVCLGVNHNSSLEGNNRVHFAIGRNTDNVEIAFFCYHMNTNGYSNGGWNGSEMKTWLNGTFYNALPADLRNVITDCTKYTDNVGSTKSDTDGNVQSSVTATSQKIWLLTPVEVTGVNALGNTYEKFVQTQYDYYKNGNSPIRYDHLDPTTAVTWSLRSPRRDNRYAGFICIGPPGVQGVSGAYLNWGVVPCFTIS